MNLKTQQSRESRAFFLACLTFLSPFLIPPAPLSHFWPRLLFITTHNPGLSGNKTKKAVASLLSSWSHWGHWIYDGSRRLQLQEPGHGGDETWWATNTFCNHLNGLTSRGMLLAGKRRGY